MRSLNWRSLIKVMYSIIQALEGPDRCDKFSPLLLQRKPALQAAYSKVWLSIALEKILQL